MAVATEELCALCGLEVGERPLVQDGESFCCSGCQAVYQVLSSKEQLEGFEEHPLFLQALSSGLISNPGLIQKLRSKQVDVSDEEIERLHLEVGEMWCPACAEVIQLVLLQEKGVKSCVVDYTTDVAAIEYAPRYLSQDTILERIASLGYAPALFKDRKENKVSRALYLRLGIAGFLALNIMMFSYPIYTSFFHGDGDGLSSLFCWISFAIALPVVSYCGWPIYRRCLTALQVGVYGMEALVTLGVWAAFGLSCFNLWRGSTHIYFDSMTMVIFFVLLGKVIETKAKFSAKATYQRLLRALPQRGRKRFADGAEAFVLLKEVAVGDLMVVKAGERIVLDGVVVEGSGGCDESVVTGEAIPILKQEADGVLGGSILSSGHLVYRVTAASSEGVLAQILHTVQGDLNHKPRYVRYVDRVIQWFVPAALALSVATFLYWGGEQGILYAVSVLLIACPCAIGIAAPLAESLLMQGLTSIGALVRNRGVLSVLGREDVVVFDKTGTITEGRFRVTGGIEQLTPYEKRALYSIASYSHHPICQAIASALEGEESLPLKNACEHISRGVEGYLERGEHVALGAAEFVAEQLSVPCHEQGGVLVTEVFFGLGRRAVRLELQDVILPEAPEVVGELGKTVLLSGDAAPVVEGVAKECHFSEWKARHTPLMKREFISSLREQGNRVAFLGDGLNDAAALGAADVGLSVVNATDLSIQVSDVLLTSSSLRVVPQLFAQARRGRAIIRQNLFWAFFYNGVGMGLASCGYLLPLYAAAAMVVSSLIVVGNALRLRTNPT